MNISEANAVNSVLRWVLRTPDPVFGPERSDAACDQAAWLADRAHRAITAGLTGDQVREHWTGGRR